MHGAVSEAARVLLAAAVSFGAAASPIALVIGSYSCIRNSLVGDLRLYSSSSRTAGGGDEHSAASTDAAACLTKEVESLQTSPFTVDDFVNARPARYHSAVSPAHGSACLIT